MAKIDNIIQEKDLLNDERISRYMEGKMNTDEESSFMEELKNNDNLRNQAIAQARLVKGMKQEMSKLSGELQKRPLATRNTLPVG